MQKRFNFLISLMTIGVTILSCGGEEDPITSQPPVFSVTPVDMSGPYDESDSTFGDIRMADPVIVPFGAMLDQTRLSPAIEYFTRPDAPVLAVTRGVVEQILENPPEQGDYEIRITALPGSDYTIIHDHVIDLFILEGSAIEPGDTLGRAGTWTENMRRAKLQVNLGRDADERSYCPLRFGDSNFVDAHNKLLQEYNRMGFSPHYDSLCLTETVQP